MSNRIEDLEPETRAMCNRFLVATAAQGIALRVTHTLRTDDEQNKLYAEGRTMPGNKVTNAKAGESPHNSIVGGLSCAFDFCFNGKTMAECYPKTTDPVWERVGQIGESLGLSWGGRWKGSLVDRDHFERPGWKGLRSPAGKGEG